jgi:hypothetical protein
LYIKWPCHKWLRYRCNRLKIAFQDVDGLGWEDIIISWLHTGRGIENA